MCFYSFTNQNSQSAVLIEINESINKLEHQIHIYFKYKKQNKNKHTYHNGRIIIAVSRRINNHSKY